MPEKAITEAAEPTIARVARLAVAVAIVPRVSSGHDGRDLNAEGCAPLTGSISAVGAESVKSSADSTRSAASRWSRISLRDGRFFVVLDNRASPFPQTGGNDSPECPAQTQW